MKLDVIFWLVVAGFYVLRMIAGAKKKASKTPILQQAQPDVTHASTEAVAESGRTGEENFHVANPDPALVPRSMPPRESPADPTQPAVPDELGQVLKELKTVFGFGAERIGSQSSVQRPDPEHFGSSEEQFEKKALYRETTSNKEDRFENRPANYVDAHDREEAFERRSSTSRGEQFEDGFESRPMSSEVSFRGRWKGHNSDFEFHSPLDKHGFDREPDTPTGVESRRAQKSLSSRLDRLGELQRAVMLHELLSAPLSRRTRSARNRLS